MSKEDNIDKTEHIEQFYKRLKVQLEEHHNFPEDYTFKFILKNSHSLMIEVYKVFDDIKYTISTRESANGKYVSCSIVAFVLGAEQVISLYKEIGKIKDVIML